MPNKNRLTYLFRQYLNNKITDSELEELFEYIKNVKTDKNLEEYVTAIYKESQANVMGMLVDWDTMFAKIVNDPILANDIEEINETDDEMEMPAKRLFIWRSVAAAIVLLIIGTGVYFYLHEKTPSVQKMAVQAETNKDIMPGGNKAILTLSNGATVLLDSMKNGKLAGQGNMQVVKVGSGILAYEKGNRNTPKKAVVQYNTLTTPRGGQYQLTLSDGTKVWLNAASSIRYPIAFNGKERKVEVTGEVYFEVAHNENQPFRVLINGEEIEDLGTRFNVNGYSDEPMMKATLLEGAIKVRNKVLQPGEQAILKDGKMRLRKDVDVSNVVAWKNGYFSFNNANLEDVMRKLARWYDIKVVYKESMDSHQQFSGRIGRDLTLSQILNGLRQTRAHFKIEKDSRTVILQ